MELQVIKSSAPILQVNFEQLRAELDLQLVSYQGIVYTDAQLAQAKADRKKLNDLKDLIKAKEKEILLPLEQPIKDFKAEVKSLLEKVADVESKIGDQVKAGDEAKRKERLEKYKEQWSKYKYHFIDFDLISKPHWKNSDTSPKSVTEDMEKTIQTIDKQLDVLQSTPNFTEAHRKHYYATLNYATIVEELNRINTPPTEQKAIVDEVKASFVNAPSLFDGFPSVPLDRSEVIDKNRTIEFVIVSRNEFDYEMIENFCKRNKLEWRNK